MRRLVQEGAQVNLPNTKDGATPILLAAQTGHADVVNYLLSHGADPNAARKDGTVNMACIRTPPERCPAPAHCFATAHTLCYCRPGVTALYKALQHDHFDCVKTLLAPVAVSEELPGEVAKGQTEMLSALDADLPSTLPTIVRVRSVPALLPAWRLSCPLCTHPLCLTRPIVPPPRRRLCQPRRLAPAYRS